MDFWDRLADSSIDNSREPNFDSTVQLGNFPTRKFASSDAWESFVERFRRGQQPLPQAWADLFGPLRTGTVDDLVIVGQVGQSLDGRVATATATRSTSTVRPVSNICTGCARWSILSWSALERRWPTIRN